MEGKRRDIIRLLAPVLAGILFLGSCRPGEKTPQAHPIRKAFHQQERDARRNLLVITLDTLRADHLSCYGYPRATSPGLDSLSRRGTLFVSAICTAPFTNPSHASLFTGRYPWENGCRSNYMPLPPSRETLAEVFRKSGYRTAAFVSGSPLKAEVSGLNQGFEVYDDAMDTPVFEQNMVLRAPNPEKKNQVRPGNPAGKPLLKQEKPREKQAAVAPFVRRNGEKTVERALQWITSSPTPWFAWVHLYDVHGPYIPHNPLKNYFLDDGWDPASRSLDNIRVPEYQKHPGDDRWDYVARYDACIHYESRCVEKLLHALQETGALKNTLIVMMADHGESLGEHDYGFDHGKWLYQPSLAVPMMFVFPGASTAGGLVNDEFISIIDVAPLLAGYALKTPPMPLFRYSDFKIKGGTIVAVNHDRWRFAETKPKHPLEPSWRLMGVCNGEWKYIHSVRPEHSRIFHIPTCPLESDCESPVPEGLVPELRAMIEKERAKLVHQSMRPRISKKERDALKALGYIDEAHQ